MIGPKNKNSCGLTQEFLLSIMAGAAPENIFIDKINEG